MKAIITEKLLIKSKLLCQYIPNLEWSAIGFYIPKGECDKDDFEVELLDLYPLNIGTSTFTSFEITPEVVTYMAMNNLLNTQTFLIHSHNKMATFFSGTDLKCLEDEAKSTNHCLSIVTNNKDEFIGKFTYKVNRTITSYTELAKINTFNDSKLEYENSYKDVALDLKEEIVVKDVTMVYPIIANLEIKDDNFVEYNIKPLLEAKEKEEENKRISISNRKITTYRETPYYTGYERSIFEDLDDYNTTEDNVVIAALINSIIKLRYISPEIPSNFISFKHYTLQMFTDEYPLELFIETIVEMYIHQGYIQGDFFNKLISFLINHKDNSELKQYLVNYFANNYGDTRN